MIKRMTIAAMACLAAVGNVSAQGTGKTMKAYMVSNAHLDTQWNWDVQATISEFVPKTMRQSLYLLDTYPEYVCNFEGGVKYKWMKEYYPLMYERVKEYVANGRWHLTGSGWDANETVVCSAESFLRNILLGQTYYRQEFGKDCSDIYLPDCFGFGWGLPTLAAHCGLIGFSTQKLGWRTNTFYSGNRKYPFPVGVWEGIDGSRIMMVHGFDYAAKFNEDLSNSESLKKSIAETPLKTIYRYYGTGDTGGSPNIPSVLSVVKGIHGNGPIQIVSATSDQLYKDFLPLSAHPELPVAKGEMTMDVHGSGVYTSQAALKLYNRQNEHLGDAAERASVAAEWLGTSAYPQQSLTEDWRRMIWHQFHDDLPGTCLPRAYEFSWNDELLTLNRFSSKLTTAVNGIASKLNTNVSGQPVVLFNTESYPLTNIAEITLPNMATGYSVVDAKGKKVASQVVTDRNGNRRLLVDANVPATGAAVYSLKASGNSIANVSKTANTVENSVYKVTVDGNGDISSIVDKRYNRELVESGKAFGLVVFTDCKSRSWPSWEILKATIDKDPVKVTDNVKVTLVENGALRKTLKVTKAYGKSSFSQYIRLYEGSQADRIDVYNEVDWHSRHSLLKANFPFAFSNAKATYDIGLGSIERGNNIPQAYEVYSHEWTDLTAADNSYGVTILNDSKYGWDKPNDNTMRLSLLWAPETGRGYTYQADQDMGWHEFTYSIVGHKGALDKTAAIKKSALLNEPIKAFTSGKHKGELGKEFSFVNCDNDNVMVHALKKAEVGDEYVIRVYENEGKEQQTAHITFAAPIAKAVEADGTEKEIGAASFSGKTLTVNIKPFSVKTYKLSFADGKPKQTVLTESVALPYDRHCFSPNGFRNQADFENGNSYAAELIPDEGITVDNIHFAFGGKDDANGVTCKGNVIKLPADGKYNKLYILAASDQGDRNATFTVGKDKQTFLVPFYSGFIGQWGHEGHTKGFYKDAEVAYVGTHTHTVTGDRPYVFGYMFKYCINIPKGVTEVTLPDDAHVVVFSATLANEPDAVKPAGGLFRTNNKTNELDLTGNEKDNVLKGAKVIASSGGKPEQMIDGNTNTEWADADHLPFYADFDLGESKAVKGWQLLSDGRSGSSYVTRSAVLLGKNSLSDDWQTLDILNNNGDTFTDRSFNAASVRYIRLYVVQGCQQENNITRVKELVVY